MRRAMRGLPALQLTPATWRLLAAALLVCYVVAGSIASVSSGLTVDDPMEQHTFRTIVSAAKSLLTGHVSEYRQLQSYGDRYYGIGFDTFAYPFQIALQPYLSRRFHIDPETALLLGARPAILLLFAVSIVCFYRTICFFVSECSVAAAISALYAVNPYLFGHAMINVRDSPFMSVYLLCTYLSLNLVRLHAGGTADCSRQMLKLGAATAFLASIRIPGLMILVQYAFTFLVADALAPGCGLRRILAWKSVACFFGVLVPLLVLFFPAVWINPVQEIAKGLQFVGWYYQPGCTLTWGVCMEARATAEYVVGWLIVKLPLFFLAGIALVPFALRKLWQNPLQRTAYLSLIFGSLYVLMVIIPLRAHLYDETRQLLFIYPLLFLSGAVAIYLTSRRVAIAGLCLSLAIFAWDQLRLNPYQYAYFNEFSRFLDVDKLFETDYWAISAREQARQLQANPRMLPLTGCLYTDPVSLFRPFVSPDTCVEPLESAAERRTGPGLVVAIAGSPNRIGLPSNCGRLSAVTRSFPLSGRTMTLSETYYCQTQ